MGMSSFADKDQAIHVPLANSHAHVLCSPPPEKPEGPHAVQKGASTSSAGESVSH